MQLMEYRPGRYAWADGDGRVIRKATDEEADRELAELAGLQFLPLFAIENGPTDVTDAGDQEQPAAVATEVIDVGEPAPVGPTEVIDVTRLEAGDLVCSNCGAAWPGTFDGFWLLSNGSGPAWWWHWCSGGRPGRWHQAELANGKGGER